MNIPTEIAKNLYMGNEKSALQSSVPFDGIVSVMMNPSEKVSLFLPNLSSESVIMSISSITLPQQCLNSKSIAKYISKL